MADATAWLTAATHATADDWAARVVTNGGAAPSANTVAAVSNFCGALDAAGISVKMMLVNVFAPDNLIASITPLYKVFGNDPWTNNNFVAADIGVHGLKGNGTSKSLNTGAIPTTIFSGSSVQGGISLYNTFPDLGTGFDFNVIDAAANYFGLSCSNAGNSIGTIWNNTAGQGQLSVPGLMLGLGFVSASRVSTSSMNLYAANSINAFSSLGSSATTGGSVPTVQTLYAFARNNNGTIGVWSGKRLSFAAIHSGLTSGETQALFNAVQQMRQAFGGGWV